MSLSKQRIQDKIEIVGEYKNIQKMVKLYQVHTTEILFLAVMTQKLLNTM
jgi:hypothetical protein